MTSWNNFDFNGFSFGATDVAEDVTIQSTGRIVVGGWFASGAGGNGWNCGMTGFMTSGLLDSTFGVDGSSRLDISLASNDRGVSLIVDGVDRLYLGGGSDSRSAICRFTQDGIIDSTFGVNGRVVEQGSIANGITQIVWDDQARLLCSGSYGSDGAIWRLSEDGTYDGSFGTNGRVLMEALASSSSFNCIAFDTATTTYTVAGNTGSDILVARFSAAGTLDTTFAGTGWTTRSLSNFNDELHSIAIDSEHRILVGGSQTNGNEAVVLRYQWNGILDTTWNENGVVVLNFLGVDEAVNEIRVQADCRVLVCGGGDGYDNLSQATLARLEPNGVLDASFGTAGVHLETIDSALNTPTTFTGMTLDNADRIIAVGRVYMTSFYYGDFLIGRYLSPNDFAVDCTPEFNLGVEELSSAGRLDLYPNPCSTQVSIQMPKEVALIQEVELFDSAGRRVAQYSNLSNGSILDLPALGNGLYLIRCSARGSVLQTKLLVDN